MRHCLLALSVFFCFCAAAQCDTFYYDYDHYKEHLRGHDAAQYLSLDGAQRESIWLQDTADGGAKYKWRDIFPFEYDTTEQLQLTEILPTLRPLLERRHALVINEAHNMPTSRTNLIPLLDGLKKLGYGDIFMETLAWNDTLRDKYGYPDMETGYYSREVMYAELLRRLMADSIRIHPYEANAYHIDTATREGCLMFVAAGYPGWVPVMADSFMLDAYYTHDEARDVTQALQIYQQLLRDSIDHYIIYCGYGHGSRSSHINMGKVLRYLTQDTMVVVDQTSLIEHSSEAFDYRLYRRYAPAEHAMLIAHADGSRLMMRHTGKDTGTYGLYDYYIITPRTELHSGRATWRALGGERQYYPISRIVDRNVLPASYLVLAYYQSEYSRLGDCAIPADILQVNDKKKDPSLVLQPGRKYFIKVTVDGKELFSKVYNLAE